MKTDLDTILALEVPLVVVLAERPISVNEVTEWVQGSIFELPKSSDEDLEIRINNQSIGLGAAVKIGENFGIRVTHVGDPKQRILAMGEEKPAEDDFVGENGMSADDIAMALLDGQL